MSRSILLPAICLLCLTSLHLCAGTKAPADSAFEKRLREFVERKQAPGIVAGLVDDKGSRVIAYGVVKQGSTNVVNGDTLFEIGSITKVFTTLVLQDMVDKGEVSLDDPISKYLPANAKTPTRNGKQITLVDLATHHSGLPRLPDNLLGIKALIVRPDNPYSAYTPEELYEFLRGYKLQRDIGAKYEYSNVGMGLLGHLLALEAGTSYEAMVKQRVCEPLKMQDTVIALSATQKARLATGHSTKGKPVSNWDFKTLEGCGAIRSSVNDMLIFLSANMGIAASPLSGAMARCQVARSDTDLGGTIGLAWHMNPSGLVWHNGGTGGYRSFLGFDPKSKRGVIILCNSENDVDELGISAVTVKKQHRAVPLEVAIFDRYVGDYQLAPKAILTISRDGEHFFARLTGQQKIEFFPESETDFFCKVVDAQLTFVRGETGPATQVILHQNGFDQKAPRVN